MARPCGCGGGGLTVRCRTGIVCSGLGTTTDPLTIAWEIPLGTAACDAVMDCVGRNLGNGLGMVNKLLSVRLAPGGGLEFDISGALRVTGVTPGGQPATVAALETVPQDVIGGALGAGFMIKPINTMRTFEYGLHAGLHFMQVPVRFLSDGSPVVYMQETLANSTPSASTTQVQQYGPHWWKTLANKPGHQILPSGTNTVDYEDPKEGWFGYLEPGEPNLVFLSDVLRDVGGKIVLLLDLRFPATNSSGEFVNITPTWRTAVFMFRVRNMIREMGLASSVIITTTMPKIPDNVPDPGSSPKFDVLKYFSDDGIAVGPMFETAQAASGYPPGATWPQNWTWAFLSWGIAPATLAGYVDQTVGSPAKRLNVILFYVSRQYLREAVVNNAAQTPGAVGVGAKGVISADPEYYLARSRYYYRHGDNSFQLCTVSPGLLPNEGENLVTMNCLRRGHHIATYRSMWFGPLNYRPPDPIANTAFSLQGWFGPFDDPGLRESRFYDVGMGFDQRTNNAADYGWMAMAFCVPTDHVFQNYSGSTVPPGIDYSRDNGYILLLDTNGYLFLWCITEGATESMAAQIVPYENPPLVIGSPGWSDPRRGKPYYFRIGINPNGIKISRLSAPGAASPGVAIYTVTSELAKRHRGGYVYFGRRGSSWNGFIDNPKLFPNAAPPNGP